MTNNTVCGYVAVVGRPNVGKSTLINHLLGQKVSITSRKPQTTRHQILMVKTTEEKQFIFVDTPGMHQKEQQAMSRYMNKAARASLNDVDVVLFVVEALQWHDNDDYVLQTLAEIKTPVILVINKVDTLEEKAQLLTFIDKVKVRREFACIVPIAANKNIALEDLEKEIGGYLPASPFLFAKDDLTDRNEKFLVAEIIREKIIRNTGQELPYSTTVGIEDWRVEKNIPHISAVIWVERQGQKAIVIGKSGEKLKRIGSDARKDIENLLGNKVFLRLWVKVKENWSNDDKLLRELGYG